MEFISFVAYQFEVYKPLIPLFEKLQQKQDFESWTDCCTGAAGPVRYLYQNGCGAKKMVFTDKYPLTPIGFPPSLASEIHAVDVLTDPIPGDGLVSFFNSFHHFNQEQRRWLLQQIVLKKRPVLVAEITQPTVVCFLVITLVTTVGQCLLAPFVKPFSWKRMLFTYLIPVNIVSVAWDGWMSVFKSLSAREFENLCHSVSSSQYKCEFVQTGPWWQKVYILTGHSIYD